MGLKSCLERPVTYRVGMVATLLFGIVLIVGVACPFWYVSQDGKIFGGIWSYCYSDTSKCIVLAVDVAEVWWLALRILETLALVCVTLCCSCLLFENCFHAVNAPRLMAEMLGIVGGALGITGCFVFVGKTTSSSDTKYSTYSWAFYFTIIGSIAVVVFVLVILVGGKSSKKSWLLRHGDEGTVSCAPTLVAECKASLSSPQWAQPSPSVARRPVGSAVSGDFSSLPPTSRPATPNFEVKSSLPPTSRPATPNFEVKSADAFVPSPADSHVA